MSVIVTFANELTVLLSRFFADDGNAQKKRGAYFSV